MGYSEYRACRIVPNMIGHDGDGETADLFVRDMKAVLGKDAIVSASVCD